VLALAIALCVPGAYAGTVTLNVTGSFFDGAALSGTITVDQSGGTVTAINLTVGAPESGTYNVIYSQGPSNTYGAYNVVVLASPGVGLPEINLFLVGTSLIGYTGGSLCSNQTPCTAPGISIASGLWRSNDTSDSLSSGTVGGATTPTSSVPALSPWALGILAILFAVSAALLLRRTQRA
jgi:hypothetical protein